MVDDHVPGLDAAASAGHPDWRALLHRARPDVDITQLVVFAVEGERLRLAPGAQDELARLLESLAHLDRRHPIRESRVHRCAEDESCGEPTSRETIEIGILLGDASRRIIERQRI